MTSTSAARIRRWAPTWLALLFAGSGALHLVRPGIYTAVVPGVLPARRGIVLASGIAELTCAGGLLRRARWAGPASALLLVGIFPANVQFTVSTTADPASPRLLVAAAWIRLPLQLPLIWAALQSRGSGRA